MCHSRGHNPSLVGCMVYTNLSKVRLDISCRASDLILGQGYPKYNLTGSQLLRSIYNPNNSKGEDCHPVLASLKVSSGSPLRFNSFFLPALSSGDDTENGV